MFTDKFKRNYKIIDAAGATVQDAESMAVTAHMQRTTPAVVARKEANDLANPIDGDFFAVEV